MNILFICSKNKWRSPTAERVYFKNPEISARSAGTSSGARHQVTRRDIEWADTIFVMEDKHVSRLRSDYPSLMKYQSVHVLHIPDDYTYMDPELIALFADLVDPIIHEM